MARELPRQVQNPDWLNLAKLVLMLRTAIGAFEANRSNRCRSDPWARSRFEPLLSRPRSLRVGPLRVAAKWGPSFLLRV